MHPACDTANKSSKEFSEAGQGVLLSAGSAGPLTKKRPTKIQQTLMGRMVSEND
jgi:hypothetical protein